MQDPVSRSRRSAILRSLAVLLCATDSTFATERFKDPLDYSARPVANLSSRPLMSVTAAGNRLVAVGSRGLVIVSSDSAKSWIQARVPVQSDLLAVHFPTPLTGWIVGHDGVVLRSDDGGLNWVKQLDGRLAADSFRRFYESRVASGQSKDKQALHLIETNYKNGAALPYLDVWFSDTNRGFAVGSYGMLIATADGGKTWVPWLDRIDSGQLNLNCVYGISDHVFIAGEQGKIYKLEQEAERFKTIETGYTGSFFGLAGNGSTLLAFGLRGVTFKSDDHGNSWKQLKMPTETTISAGVARREDGSFLLVNGAGELIVGDRNALQFTIVRPQTRMRLTGIISQPDESVVITGLGGVATERVPTPN
ncbi:MULTISPECIES: YCF48-related protein [Paraburkholderia]|uniref:YCF48-related protein n=1 Tax=Paraburkholderia madseniana TaxID=2599607 RepID=A0AAP5BKS6_9BURK|nr:MULTISPECIES: YCF48-related protein [Paraburkholderia]MCX4149964.1 YCF48-related protein [Paraburkholderia madseniana]MDN7152900.1 YCF48-related protein [Paraburkholderia sp. WS6]MDQ6411782.1 YCF48-related protein [Paraburkholderia madseniana]